MGEFSYALYRIALPRAIYKHYGARIIFRFMKYRRPFRYSLMHVAYACLSEMPAYGHLDKFYAYLPLYLA
jgi:hypothetical protein